MNFKVVITTDGEVNATARLYDGRTLVKSVTAVRNVNDDFDFSSLARRAFERVISAEPKKPKYYFSCKRYCIDKFGAYTRELENILAKTAGYAWVVKLDGKEVDRRTMTGPAPLKDANLVVSFPEWEEIR